MRDFFRIKTWLITFLMFAVAISLSAAIVYFEFSSKSVVKTINASADNNVSGWAWNSNIGWISFNCTNDSTPCSGTNYGVSVDPATGDFSGYAWSSSVGWIDFAPASGYPEAPNTGAHYDSATGAVTGWAKILSMGDDGWLKMSDASWINGVSIDSGSGDFSGYAWNANNNGAGIGWVSFNCSNDTPACGNSNYKVVGLMNQPPTAIDLTSPNWSFSEASQYGALNAKLGWIFRDDDAGASQSAYEIIARKASDNSLVFDSGKCLGMNSCEPVATCDPAKCKVDNGAAGTTYFPLTAADGLNYGISYYWWVQVWDDNDVASALTQYNTAQDIPLEADDGVSQTFTTYSHEMPDSDFTYSPSVPSRGEEVKFYDASKVYLNGAPDTAIDCTSTLCSWSWSATAGAEFKNGDTSTSTPTITFTSAGNSTVTLTVTDSQGYQSIKSTVININSQLPKWKEVK